MVNSRRRGYRSLVRALGIYVVLSAVALVMCAPFMWMLASSVKPNEDIFAYPPAWLPSRITFQHYEKAFSHSAFPRYFLNSFVVAGTATIVNLFFCSLAGYAFSKLDFFGRDVIFMLILGTMMIPVHVTLVPLFIITKRFPFCGGNNALGIGGTGLIDTYGGLLVPYLLSVFGVFMVRQFCATIPDELREAARIDGAGEFDVYWRIMLPLIKPVLATLSIFVFTTAWDDFLWPLVITNSDSMRTVQLGLQVFQMQHAADWGPLMAATVVVTMPVLVVFVIGQKHFVQGIATTGLKG